MRASMTLDWTLFGRRDSHCGSLAMYVLCDANTKAFFTGPVENTTAPIVTHEHILLAYKNLNTKTPQKLYTGRGD
jgi:hypothetical protein